MHLLSGICSPVSGPPALAVHKSRFCVDAGSLWVRALDLLWFLGPGLDLVPALWGSQ